MRFILSLVFSLMISVVAYMSTASADQSVRTKPLPGSVTLTFDDGPSPVYTPQILAILKRYRVHAVFFAMGGIARQNPELIKDIVRQGHVLANHSVSHLYLPKLSDKKLQYEIAEANVMLTKAAGVRPVCFRPPFFGTNARVREVIARNDLIQVLGFMTRDYENKGVDWLVNNVLNNVHSGSILVFHDGYRGRAQTVAALPAIIEGIRKKGLSFSTICHSV